jgi:Leucine-rich repeat (LRR) protein
VNLNQNQISEISPQAFFGLTKLQKLYLNYNQLRAIPQLESVASSLQQLYMSNNFCVDDGVPPLSDFPKMFIVDLTKNLLTTLPTSAAFPSPSVIRDLYLSENPFESVPVGGGDVLTAMKKLELRACKLDDALLLDVASNYFTTSHALESLNLRSNSFRNVPAVLSARFPLLKTLDISDNPLSSFEAVTYPCIEELKIVGAQNFVIPNLFLEFLPNITKLAITYAEVKEIPPLSIVESSVESLDFSHNHINSLTPFLLANCTSLETLDLSYNQLSSFPSDLFALKNNMRELDLGENHLITIEDGAFSFLGDLEILHLERNKFKDFPMEISKLLSLHELWLHTNKSLLSQMTL